MADLLSMALLSTEAAPATKALSANQTQAESAEVDQSFAATLAAEVNGKAPEKSQKSSAKVRQNTASEQDERKTTQKKSAEKSELKKFEQQSDEASARIEKNTEKAEVDTLEAGDADSAIKDQSDATATEAESDDAQSSLFSLLEQAKSLQQRLSKADQEKASAADRAAETTEATSDSNEEAADAEIISDAEIKLASTAAQAKVKETAAKVAQISSLTAAENELSEVADAASETATTDQLKSLKLPEQLLTAVKNAQADNSLPTKVSANVSAAVTDSDSTAVSEFADEIAGQNSTAKVSVQLMAGAESAAKAVDSRQSQKVVENEKPLASVTYSETTVPSEPVLAANQILSSMPSSAANEKAAAKTAVVDSTATEASVTEDSDDTQLTVNSLTEPKLSVQAQSAAALVTQVTQQAKPQQAEAKVSTEELLKQAAAEQFTAESDLGQQSSGHESQPGSSQTLLTETAQLQSKTVSQAYEQNSFASQLKASIEKAIGTTQTATGTAASEQVQKQADQLGQKLSLIQPEASAQLKEKMLMMVKDKVHTAEIRLDPAELGSMQIKINLQQDQMSVQFIVQQGHAKDLMEQQMPKLRELLQQQGIELSQGSVQQQNQSSSGQGEGRGKAGQTTAATLDGVEELVDLPPGAKRNPDRVVDYYA